MKKLYTQLRMQMLLNGVDQTELARRLGRSGGYVSDRMRGKGAWSLGEAWKMTELLPGADGQPLPLGVLFPLGEIARRAAK